MADTPKVVGGKLDRPYPIKSRGDVNRAKVLPPPRMDTTPAPAAPSATPPTPSRDKSLDRPQGGFDYVVKRNNLMKGISDKSPRSRRGFGGRRA